MNTYIIIYLCGVILVTNTDSCVCLGCGVYAAWRRWFWQTGLGERRPPRCFHRTQRGQLPLPESGQRGLQPHSQGTQTSITADTQAPGEWVLSEPYIDMYFGLGLCVLGCWSKHCASKEHDQDVLVLQKSLWPSSHGNIPAHFKYMITTISLLSLSIHFLIHQQ